MRNYYLFIVFFTTLLSQATPLSLNELAYSISRKTAVVAQNYSVLNSMSAFRTQVQTLSASDSNFSYPTGKKVLYFFGGADVFFASKLFPDFERLVIVARENVKVIPTVDSEDTRTLEYLSAGVNYAHNTELLSYSFIKTNDAGVKTSKDIGMSVAVAGAMSALGFRLKNAVYYSEINCDVKMGGCQPVAVADPSRAKRIIGVEIYFTKGNDPTLRSVAYFNEDLGNQPQDGYYRDPNFFTYLKQVHFDTSYYKAASYLSQKSFFTQANEVAESSDYVLQSDCGLPFKDFAKNDAWNVNLYGFYTHRPAFASYIETQSDLKDAYASSIRAQDRTWQNVHYGFDYNLRYDYAGVQRDVNKFNLMIAHKVK